MFPLFIHYVLQRIKIGSQYVLENKRYIYDIVGNLVRMLAKRSRKCRLQIFLGRYRNSLQSLLIKRLDKYILKKHIYKYTKTILWLRCMQQNFIILKTQITLFLCEKKKCFKCKNVKYCTMWNFA